MELDQVRGVTFENGKVKIEDLELFKEEGLPALVREIVSREKIEDKAKFAWVIWEVATQVGIRPASINELYRARGRGECSGFTVPAINIRTLTYDIARALFRVANKLNAGAFILEIARSEIGYTDQRPLEYAAVCMAAAIKEDYKGPIFLQGDHFQLKAKDYQADKERALSEIKKLIREAIAAGFYNIDIDASTLVDLSKPSLEEQQHENAWVTAELTRFIRELQPEDVTISIGGEIGEVGGKNSTPEDLHAFMQSYMKQLDEGLEGISKISIQTGTTHGGVVLPDGSIAKVKIDFDTLKSLSQIARSEYGMAGAVQHGASTLPKEAFHKFPEVETAEIHLATQFQNIVYENMPQELRDRIYQWLKENFKSEWKEGQTEEQFIYKVRKQALGPFKQEIFNLPQELKDQIAKKIEDEFEFLFKELRVQDTKELVGKYIKPPLLEKKIEDLLPKELAEAKFEGAD
jgi:fructose/tagatose bisphosphate aldolase